MIISIDGKVISQNSTFIHDKKNSYKLWVKIYLNIIKAIYEKPTANTPKKKAESLPIKFWNKDAHSLLYSTYIGSPSHSNQKGKEIKDIQIGREEVKS